MVPDPSPLPAPPRGNLWVALACLGPIGRRLPAPGTWGSAVGLALAVLLVRSVPDWSIGWVTLALALPAVWICTQAERGLGRSDPGEVILDEVVAMPLCFLGWARLESSAAPWLLFAVGFALFRFFDAVKFGPMAWADRQFKGFGPRGGFGIMLDDLLAAFCTLLVLALWTFIQS